MIARIEALLRNDEGLRRRAAAPRSAPFRALGSPARHLPRDRPYVWVFDLANGFIRPQTSMINSDAAIQEVCKFPPGVAAE